MKRSVRPLFSALLFAFFAATLICRVAIRRRSFSFTSAIAELGSSGLITEEIVFNETLLEFAAIDPGEPKFKQEVDLISDYDNTRRSHRRHFSSMSRPIEQQQQQRHGNRDIASKFPVTLRSPQVGLGVRFVRCNRFGLFGFKGYSGFNYLFRSKPNINSVRCVRLSV